MIIENLTNNLGQFYFDLKDKIKKIYQNSSFYDKKISRTKDINFDNKMNKVYKIDNRNIKEV